MWFSCWSSHMHSSIYKLKLSICHHSSMYLDHVCMSLDNDNSWRCLTHAHTHVPKILPKLHQLTGEIDKNKKNLNFRCLPLESWWLSIPTYFVKILGCFTETVLYFVKSFKERSVRSLLLWPNISIVVNVVFQEILSLTRVRHTVSSKRVTVNLTM